MKRYRWDGGFTPLKDRDKQQIDIIRPALVPDEADAEVGPMLLARFPDGFEQMIYEDEIEEIRPVTERWVLWGKMQDGTPIKIDAGTLPQMRREADYRKRLIATGGFYDLRIRAEGHPYSACPCATCDTDRDPSHPSYEIRPLLGVES